MTTLAEARAEYWHAVERRGTECPCCDRWGKIYRTPLGTGMVRSLMAFYSLQVKRGPGEWIFWHDVQTWLIDHGCSLATNYAGLRYWDLIEPRPVNTNPKTKSSGFWRVTSRGRRFVLEEEEVPSHALLYNKRRLRYDGLNIGIKTAAKKEFDYPKLMSEWAIVRDDDRADKYPTIEEILA